MAHVARRNHGFDLSTKNFLQSRDEVDLESVGIFEDLRIEEHLVGFAEAKVELILVEQLLVSLTMALAKSDNKTRAWNTYFGALEFHCDGL